MRFVTTALVGALVAALAIGCGGTTGESSPPPATTSDPPPASTSRVPAPAIEGMSIEGEEISLGDFRGRPVMINVWSSW